MPQENDNEITSTEPSLQPELTQRLLQLHSNEGHPKRIPNETAKAASELLRLFIIEARSRASIEVSKRCKRKTLRDLNTRKGICPTYSYAMSCFSIFI